jgi:hypothetical protein
VPEGQIKVARDFQINGETLVRVRGNPSTPFASATDLGLAQKEVRIVPRFVHHDVHIDDFGPDVPVDVHWMLAEVSIRMTLAHYDANILKAVWAESMGGGTEGTMVGAGTPMGAGVAVGAAGNHYVSLNLLSPVLGLPWRFRACYLANTPFEQPLGTERTLAVLTWRAIPYVPYPSSVGELTSTGAVLWDRVLDT